MPEYYVARATKLIVSEDLIHKLKYESQMEWNVGFINS